MAPEQLTDSPVIIYASIIVGVVIVVAGSVPKVLGPMGRHSTSGRSVGVLSVQLRTLTSSPRVTSRSRT